MSEICDTCGLPKELCVCESIAKESQTITVYVEKKKFQRKYTIIQGIDQKEINMKELTKDLKAKLACGGTIKEGKIELQGDHKTAVRDTLIKLGFPPETIKVEDRS
ncbi:translation initiation factor [Candidatus Woesearchaeota archaeon]|nr:translation initiation factor [Candidatus Woesearchaeota archaeon]